MAVYSNVRHVPYRGQYAFNNAFYPGGGAIAGFDNLDMNTRNILTNKAFQKEYNAQHPFKSIKAKLTGGDSGFSPLGTPGTPIDDTVSNLGSVALDAGQMLQDAKTPGSRLNKFYTTKIAPNFGWSKGSGIKAFGKNVGKWGNIAGGAIQGIEALGNLQDLNESQSTTDDLIGDILNSANANPLVSSYLTPDQLSLLRQVKRGVLDPETEFGDFLPDDMSDFGDILKDAGLGLAIGGIPGAFIGGIGGAINSGLSGATEDQSQQNAELEMLLQALEDANMQYQSMKRPNLPALGIQSRYQNMYY